MQKLSVLMPLAIAMLAGTVSASAADKAPASSSERKPGEQLLAQPPRGWTMAYQLNNGPTRITDFMPSGQSEKKWDSKLTFEAHATLVGSDPTKIILDQVAGQKKMCKFVQHFSLFTGKENNYPTSTSLIMCGENHFTKRGEVSMFKAISGQDYLYIVGWTRHVAPFEKNNSKVPRREIAAWSTYFRHVSLCNSGSADHPCPELRTPNTDD